MHTAGWGLTVAMSNNTSSTTPDSRSGEEELLHFQQLDIENERLIGADESARAAWAVGEV